MRSINWNITIAATVCTVIAMFLILCGAYGFPPPYTDAINYVVPAIEFAGSKGLVNPIYPVAKVVDNLGIGRFVYNVPLFPWMLGLLMPQASAVHALVTISLINVCSLFLSLDIFLIICSASGRKIGISTAWLCSLALCGLATSFTGHYGGRPEILGTFLVLVCVCIAIHCNKRFHPFILGIGLGLLGATLPQAGILFAIAVCGFFSYESKTNSALLSTAIFITTGAILFCLILSASPYGLRETIDGTLRHMRLIGENMPHGFHWNLYLFYTNATFYGLLPTCFFMACIKFYKNNSVRWQSPLIAAICAFLLVALSLFFGPAQDRTAPVFMFAPFFYASAIYIIRTDSWKPLKAFTVIVLLLTTSGFARMTLLLPQFMLNGLKLQTARALYAEFSAKYPDYRFGISDSLWVLTEDYGRLNWCEFQRKEHCDTTSDKLIILWQQSGHGRLTPPAKIGDLVLLTNYFNPIVPKLGPIKLSNTLPDYSFAVYIPKKDLMNEPSR